MAQTDPYEFRWMVPDVGYEIVEARWATGEHCLPPQVTFSADRRMARLDVERYEGPWSEKPGRFLVERMDLDNKKASWSFPLSEETGLFRELAALHPATEDKVVNFANRFGSLFALSVDLINPCDPAHPLLDRKILGSNLPLWTIRWHCGEPLAEWMTQAKRMSQLVRLWEGIEAENEDFLSQVIQWQDAENGAYSVGYEDLDGPGFTVVASDDVRPDVFADFRHHDLVEPAKYALQLGVNKHLQGCPTHSRLLWTGSRGSAGRRLGLRVVPSSLIGALWLQFASAIEGAKRYLQCLQCKRWFEVGGPVREGSKFCRRACRFKHYRERQKEARRLNKEGMSPRDIARELDTTASTVRGWLKGQKR